MDEGERFEDALARVRKCVGGGNATENADSDSDIEVVADSVPVNLRCPVSSVTIAYFVILEIVLNEKIFLFLCQYVAFGAFSDHIVLFYLTLLSGLNRH